MLEVMLDRKLPIVFRHSKAEHFALKSTCIVLYFMILEEYVINGAVKNVRSRYVGMYLRERVNDLGVVMSDEPK